MRRRRLVRRYGRSHAAYRAAMDADDAWSAELRRRFGKNAGDVRYTAKGKGPTGSNLRRLHDAKIAADARLRGEA